MRSVLFVDDEPKILSGLRRMLRSLRQEWRMDFAEGGREALERLAASPYDVVVTDMRMPGMDGSKLLREVMNRHPSTVRIVLSGQCDRQTALAAIDSTHQFLTKPCDPELLISTLIHACQLRENLVDESHRELVSRVSYVPSLPCAYDDLVAELKAAVPSAPRIAGILARDVGMTAKIMQLVHSSFFGPARRISDPVQAVRLFDLETIRALVFSTAAFAPFRAAEMAVPFLERLLDRSLAVAAAARRIAVAERQDALTVEDTYLAGFLRDVGMLVIAEHVPRSLRAALEQGSSVCQAEMEVVGAAHGNIGGYLAALWGLPRRVVQAITLHHRPGSTDDRGFTPLAAVHVAGAMDEERFLPGEPAAGSIDFEYTERSGLSGRLDAWREICRSGQLQGVVQ